MTWLLPIYWSVSFVKMQFRGNSSHIKLVPNYSTLPSTDSSKVILNCTSLLLTIACLLLPKTGALIDTFSALDLDIACITETWFKPGSKLRSKLDDIEGDHGIKIIHRSRDGRSMQAGGGVAIAFRTGACNLRKRELKSREDGQEILCVTGKIGKIPKKVAVLVV